MKISLVLILFLIPFFVKSQDVILPVENNAVVYTSVVNTDSVGKTALFSRAKKWMQHFYTSPKDVIQVDDSTSGEVLGKSLFAIAYYSRNPVIQYTINVVVKENRYKYSISNLYYKDNHGDNFYIDNFPKSWAGKNKLYKLVDEQINIIIASLKDAMKKSTATDW